MPCPVIQPLYSRFIGVVKRQYSGNAHGMVRGMMRDMLIVNAFNDKTQKCASTSYLH